MSRGPYTRSKIGAGTLDRPALLERDPTTVLAVLRAMAPAPEIDDPLAHLAVVEAMMETGVPGRQAWWLALDMAHDKNYVGWDLCQRVAAAVGRSPCFSVQNLVIRRRDIMTRRAIHQSIWQGGCREVVRSYTWARVCYGQHVLAKIPNLIDPVQIRIERAGVLADIWECQLNIRERVRKAE